VTHDLKHHAFRLNESAKNKSPSMPADPTAAQLLKAGGPVTRASMLFGTELQGAPVAQADVPQVMMPTDTSAENEEVELPAAGTGLFGTLGDAGSLAHSYR
jgi:hypothetical protein